jgi:hypothetical protein
MEIFALRIEHIPDMHLSQLEPIWTFAKHVGKFPKLLIMAIAAG